MSEKQEDAHLVGLGERLMVALELRRKGDIDKAQKALKAILQTEPRLAEPRLELASIQLEAGQLEEAEAQAEEAISILDEGGQWTEEIGENVLRSMAWSLLAEALRRQAESDERVFGSPEQWKELMDRAGQAFAKAEELDPQNEHVSEWAFGLRPLKSGEEL